MSILDLQALPLARPEASLAAGPSNLSVAACGRFEDWDRSPSLSNSRLDRR
jgi:hypothetical protein